MFGFMLFLSSLLPTTKYIPNLHPSMSSEFEENLASKSEECFWQDLDSN